MMAACSIPPDGATFFVAKANNMNSLKECYREGIWACNTRNSTPQPKDTLSEALDAGPVVLIYSVNNCHGWHGYVEMLSKPGSETTARTPQQNTNEGNDENVLNEQQTCGKRVGSDTWQRFRVRWISAYLDGHGEKCLPFSQTASLCLADGNPVNNSRNWDVIGPDMGLQMCQMINTHIQELNECRQRKIAEQDARRPPAFFKADEKTEDAHEIWKRLTVKVEAMGQVLLACAFGSQRYNLHTPTSDVDMFIVYAAPTKHVLGFNPPQHTIKNRDVDYTCDYTVHEVHRYAELLLAGDPRCVETLFLHPSSIYSAHPTWEQLVQHRHLFLTRACCEKYVRDADGSRGLKLMQKWEKAGEALAEPMPSKVAKLFYIIIRLLQNAREVAEGRDLKVYREENSPERELLVDVRASRKTHRQLMDQVSRLQESIKKALEEKDQENEPNLHQGVVEDWLMRLRYEDFKRYMTEKT